MGKSFGSCPVQYSRRPPIEAVLKPGDLEW
jgi:hypothetical protein